MSPRPGRILAASIALSLVGLAGCGGSSPSASPAPSANLGDILPAGRAVPDTPLVDQNGQAVTLQSFRGKYVVLAPFLTLCQDECPITTGAFQDMQASVAKAGLSSDVEFVEATLDPGRDIPARLLAYQKEFGADWTLLTGTAANTAALWHFFGIGSFKVAEPNPPAQDWWTHQPLTYDVDHTNGFILIDPAGDERFITTDLPMLDGKLSLQLRDLLDEEGYQHLLHGLPGQSYTIPQAVGALSWLMHRHLTIAGT